VAHPLIGWMLTLAPWRSSVGLPIDLQHTQLGIGELIAPLAAGRWKWRDTCCQKDVSC
jgi:hypothetical protein